MTPDSSPFPDLSPFIAPERIVYGTDFSEAAARVLPRVLELAESCGADVEMVHVLDQPRTGAMGDLAGEQLKKGYARARLEHMRMAYAYAFAGRGQVKLTRAVVLASDPVEGMIDVVRRRPSAFVALGTHGASGAARQRLGSVTTQLLLQPVGPALIVPSTGSLAARLRTIVAVQTLPDAGGQSPALRMGRVLARSLEAALESVVLRSRQASAEPYDVHLETATVVETVTPNLGARATWVEAVLRAASSLGADLVVAPRRLVLTANVTHDAFAVALASTASCSLLVV
ncbi:MAG: universal stress protein [Bacteroidetes bacterium]|jgi:nucleotide-binding universal stress UspA family protein|nr:universal stress protein [Bacteroidota bacterium]